MKITEKSLRLGNREEALHKLKKYCAYQERCHQEVRTKLISLKIYGEWLEQIIAELIQEDFLNEERFARSYVRGKYRIKKWGRNKIERELKMRRVSTYCIKKGLTEIEEDVYMEHLSTLILKYINERKGRYEAMALNKKAFNHAMTKGYEYHLIKETIESINSNPN